MTDEIKNQILAVRDTGATNMFLVNNVRYLAQELGFSELDEFLADRANQRAYGDFICFGDRAEEEE